MFDRTRSRARTRCRPSLKPPSHSLGIAVGGIVERPGIVDGRIEPREYLRVTVDFDHDLVDGFPNLPRPRRRELTFGGVGWVEPVRHGLRSHERRGISLAWTTALACSCSSN